MMNKIEIMSPVGSYESLQAAIQGGANAVYFGVGKLNMRSRSAANFTIEDLQRIVQIAREAGVRTYLTVNTIIYNNEIPITSPVSVFFRHGVSLYEYISSYTNFCNKAVSEIFKPAIAANVVSRAVM